jgi:hypothetical protein
VRGEVKAGDPASEVERMNLSAGLDEWVYRELTSLLQSDLSPARL